MHWVQVYNERKFHSAHATLNHNLDTSFAESAHTSLTVAADPGATFDPTVAPSRTGTMVIDPALNYDTELSVEQVASRLRNDIYPDDRIERERVNARRPDIILTVGLAEAFGVQGDPILQQAAGLVAGELGAQLVNMPFPVDYMHPSGFQSGVPQLFNSQAELARGRAINPDLDPSQSFVLPHGSMVEWFRDDLFKAVPAPPALARRGLHVRRPGELRVMLGSTPWNEYRCDVYVDTLAALGAEARSAGFTSIRVFGPNWLQQVRPSEGIRLRAYFDERLRNSGGGGGVELNFEWETFDEPTFAWLLSSCHVALQAVGEPGLGARNASATGLPNVYLFDTSAAGIQVPRSAFDCAHEALELGNLQSSFRRSTVEAQRFEAREHSALNSGTGLLSLGHEMIESALPPSPAPPLRGNEADRYANVPANAAGLARELNLDEPADIGEPDIYVLSMTGAATNLQLTIEEILATRSAKKPLIVLTSAQIDVDTYRTIFHDAVADGRLKVCNVHDFDGNDLLDIDSAGFPLPAKPSVKDREISRKRNLGLLIAKAIGAKAMVFLDDDIFVPEGPTLAERARNAVGRLAKGVCHIVSLRYQAFADKSIVGHIAMDMGYSDAVFVGGGAEAMLVDEVDPFWAIYNEDWLQVLRSVLDGTFAFGEDVRQFPSFPFVDLERVVPETPGEHVALAIYNDISCRIYLGLSIKPGEWQPAWSETFFREAKAEHLAALTQFVVDEQAKFAPDSTRIAALRESAKVLESLDPVWMAAFASSLLDGAKDWRRRVDRWHWGHKQSGQRITVDSVLNRLQTRLARTPSYDIDPDRIRWEDVDHARLMRSGEVDTTWQEFVIEHADEWTRRGRRPGYDLTAGLNEAVRGYFGVRRITDVDAMFYFNPTWSQVKKGLIAHRHAVARRAEVMQRRTRYGLAADALSLARVSTLDPKWFEPTGVEARWLGALQAGLERATASERVKQAVADVAWFVSAGANLTRLQGERVSVGAPGVSDPYDAMLDVYFFRSPDKRLPSIAEVRAAQEVLAMGRLDRLKTLEAFGGRWDVRSVEMFGVADDGAIAERVEAIVSYVETLPHGPDLGF